MSSEWPVVRLGDLVEIKHGWPFKSDFFASDSKHSDLPIVVAIGNFEYSGGFRFSTTQTKRYCADFPNEYVLRPGEILLVMTCQTAGGEILGIPARIPDDGRVYLHNQRLGRVVPKSKAVYSGFLYWLFLHANFNRHLVNSASGTKILHTAPTRIESFQFRLPPFVEQRDIASVLSALDDRITLLRETNATLEAIAQALFKSWFVDFDPVRVKMEGRAPEGMDEATAALFPDALEESELGWVPKGWRVAKFEDFVQRLPVGQKFDQKTANAQGNVPILDQGKSGMIGFHDEGPGVRASLDEPVVVFANHTCYMRLITYDFSAIQNVLPFKGKGIDTVWAYYATKGRVKFSEYKGHWPDFTIEKAVVPSLCLGDAFRLVVDPLMRRIRLNEIQSDSLASLRDTLLPRLISGRLRLPDAEVGVTTA